ncbi:two-component response regulator [Gemmatimonas aurantiaca T-27]|uniref:Two-component response regulator n=1 Tax=Gemmatimonas aurantiaca (strain DSM 14586 / JCM 11422 / NBRC 100505 / T-27) TaxID=379066 RepID=C1A8M2_GEMAT|nr:response regulator [Gemmatimonas aurantiaca]BAH38582.1 two-component response regulator [Gemmatimonas aurantiaca T-27]
MTVLVVDDEPHIGRIIRTRLEQDGFRVLLAEHGPEALAMLQAEPDVALIVLDLMLPGMSGIDVLRTVRHDTRWAALPCIVLTAAGQDTQLREAEALGASEIMSKPFSPRGLLGRVRRYTARDAAADEASAGESPTADGASPETGVTTGTRPSLP